MKEMVVENLADFEKQVEEIFVEIINYRQADKAVVVALSGNLGVGKTTFVQMLAKKFGINEKVTSPTFTIFKVYEISSQENFSRLIHMDAYRIEDLSELKPLRFFELLDDKKTLLCIEWAEKIVSALPKNIIKIHIEILDGGQRKIIWD
jgi:tRNA threonylcarbamoyladenosine biosynthesis protein TsaE